MLSSSSLSANLNSNEQKRDWLSLPSDVMANILQRIGVVDILENAQKVCTAWRKICKEDSALYRAIKMNILSSYEQLMCKQAVDRSQGQLLDISLRSCNDELLFYVADSSKELRRLEFVSSSCNVLRIPLIKFPFLEELNFYSSGGCMNVEFIETVGRYCTMLKTLKLNHRLTNLGFDDNEVAIAIGKNLHSLRHLELIGNNLSDTGLQAILDSCVCLETLDLRNCLEIDLNGDLEKRCFQQIKTLKLPDDSLE